MEEGIESKSFLSQVGKLLLKSICVAYVIGIRHLLSGTKTLEEKGKLY